MKNKHHGFACLIVFGLSLASILGYGVYLADTVTGSIQIPGPAAVMEIKAPDDKTLAYMNYLIPHLKEIAGPGKNDSPVDLKLFGFSPLPSFGKTDTFEKSSQQEAGTASKQEEMIIFPYSLTLSFASLKKNFCVIDGKLYEIGGVLPDNGKILKIQNDRVLIQKQNKKEWLYLLQIQNVSSEKSEEPI
ncbi:MAG: hypothetical protein A2277_07150 [Desulfobacterales bacterium RIFOXYA12_FULL_46_15]|nr:MAG: hypothetical protein A2097_14220 [Desulfobacula sp. GWF2_41_7]OGR28337.1 MAG: hypothetical protein A2277_07150 [Desulfobacterales bacterium RIFOXYA12_FULL_46_15]